jgi:hypothetical protein
MNKETKKTLSRLDKINEERDALIASLNIDRSALNDAISSDKKIAEYAKMSEELNFNTVTKIGKTTIRFTQDKVQTSASPDKTRTAGTVKVTDLDNGKEYTGTQQQICDEYVRPNGKKYEYFKSFKTKASDLDKTKLKFEITS